MSPPAPSAHGRKSDMSQGRTGQYESFRYLEATLPGIQLHVRQTILTVHLFQRFDEECLETFKLG